MWAFFCLSFLLTLFCHSYSYSISSWPKDDKWETVLSTQWHSRLTQQNMSTQNRSRNINLLVSSRDALPLSGMRLVGAKVTYVLLNWVHVTNIQHTAKTGIAIRAYSQDRNVMVFILRRSFFLSSRLCHWLKKTSFPCIHQA